MLRKRERGQCNTGLKTKGFCCNVLLKFLCVCVCVREHTKKIAAKMTLLRFVVIAIVFSLASGAAKKPHIIVIIADDLGFNDVGFHGSDEIPTPNIDALAYNGVILNGHYTQALCTPSRSTFLTGKYPIHTGMQHFVILEPEPWGMPLNETIMPQHLKKNGYSTHLVGKWNLGFFKKEYTPTYRGFDTHFGYWQGLQDYYDHTAKASYTNEVGYDMRRNMTVAWDAQGKYSTTLFTEEAVKLIHEHDTEKPMFMYLAHLAAHSGNDNDPLQAPDEEIAKFSYIQDPERRIYAAMVSLLDKSIGSVMTALREKHMLENSIILFFSDNGAQPEGIHANHGSNYPFRGTKGTAWEGGQHNVAAIWSPLIKSPQRVSNATIHLSDWLPTLFSAAGLNKTELGNIDGIDQWKSISEGTESPRTELLYNIDDVWKYGAIRQGDWKYIYGSTTKGKKDTWFGDAGKKDIYHYDMESVLNSPTASAIAGMLTYQQIKEKNENPTKVQNSRYSINLLDAEKLQTLRHNATIKCKKLTTEEQSETTKCDLMKSPCLFNLRNDPCEMVNLASQHPLIVKNLETAILTMRKTALPPRNIPADPRANPILWNNTWVNWQDYEYVEKTKINFNHLSPLAIGLIAGACIAVFVVIVILMIISCKPRSKRSRPMSFMEANIEDDFGETSRTKGHVFEEREMKVKPFVKNELRTME